MEHTVGEMIRKLREESNISRGKLCKGLCTPQMLDLIEQGKSETDKYTYDILLQRLGKASNKLELILSEEEYRCMRVKDLIEELCWRGKKEKALYLLEKYMGYFTRKTNVQEMFEFRVKAYISRRIDRNIEVAEEYIQQAIKITMPGISIKNMEQYMISEIEMENLLALGLCWMDRGENASAQNLLEACQAYIKARVTDREESAIVYSKCVWLLSQIYMKNGLDAKGYMCCEEAMQDLRKFGILYFMVPLLKQLIIFSEKMGIDEKKNQWRLYYKIIAELYENYGKPWYCLDSLFHNFYGTAYHLDSEFIRQERIAQNVTQERLIEGVYQSPESLSRVENGKVKPTKNKLEGLMKNLGIEGGRSCGTIVVENFETLELKLEIDILIGQGKYAEAKIKLKELEKVLNREWKINQIVLDNYQETLNVCLETGNLQETLEKERELLKESYWGKKEQYIRVPLESELMLLNETAIILRKLERIDEANKIFLQVIEAVEKSSMKAYYRSRIASLAYANLTMNTKEARYCEKGLRFELACGKGTKLPYYLQILSYLEKERNSVKQAQFIEYAYCLCELFYRTEYKEVLKKYYKKTFARELRLSMF